MDNRPIGVFDSGVGGMTVLKELVNKMPQENYIYLGDTKNFPYGNKSKQAIIEVTKNAVELLIEKNVKLVIIACGTASCQALEEVQKLYDIPIIGVLQPTAKYIKETNKRNIGVIATRGTVNNKGWEKVISDIIPNAHVQSVACPLLAPLVEEGWYDNEITKLVVQEYIKLFSEIETLILGCTHYSLLENVIKGQIGKDIEVINVGTHVANEVNYILKQNLMENYMEKSKIQIYLTDKQCKFEEIANILLKEKIQLEFI